MVVLADKGDDYESKGFTAEKMSEAFATMARKFGMPIDTSLRDRMSATEPACRAVVATRLHAPDAEERLLRGLRTRHFAGEHLEDEATRAAAARDAGVDPAQLETWMATDEVSRLLDEDRAAARDPSPAALAQDDRLASWSGGRRYTCPSYLISAEGEEIDVPGFQPFAAYSVAIGNLAPQLPRRESPASVLELLQWAGEPLATREVAEVCEIADDEAREQLGRVATERHLGADGLWSPA